MSNFTKVAEQGGYEFHVETDALHRIIVSDLTSALMLADVPGKTPEQAVEHLAQAIHRVIEALTR